MKTLAFALTSAFCAIAFYCSIIFGSFLTYAANNVLNQPSLYATM